LKDHEVGVYNKTKREPSLPWAHNPDVPALKPDFATSCKILGLVFHQELGSGGEVAYVALILLTATKQQQEDYSNIIECRCFYNCDL